LLFWFDHATHHWIREMRSQTVAQVFTPANNEMFVGLTQSEVSASFSTFRLSNLPIKGKT
jgi:hypothetical protein